MTVLFDTRERHWGQNPYMQMLADSVGPGATPLGFSWRTALCGRYDVFHIHWPEYLLKMPTVTRRIAARFFFVLFLLRIRIFHVAVVRTRHNKSAHVDLGMVDTFLLSLLQRRVVSEIRMNRLDVDDLVPGRSPHIVYIPHGNYHPYLSSIDRTVNSSVPSYGRLNMLCFGILRPYKNFDEVVRAVIATPKRLQVRLHVAGTSVDADYTASLRELANGNEEIVNLDVGRVDDQKLVELISSSDYVIVPYAELYNSGVILLALSLNTPVIMQDSDAAWELFDEFGDAWVKIYAGPFSSDVVASVVRNGLAGSVSAKTLTWSSCREWPFIGSETVRVYRHALRRRSGVGWL